MVDPDARAWTRDVPEGCVQGGSMQRRSTGISTRKVDCTYNEEGVAVQDAELAQDRRATQGWP